MNVIIAGSRHFDDYKKLCEFCDEILEPYDDITIFSGKARGTDRLGEEWADDRGWAVKCFPAKWYDIEGKKPYEVGTNKKGNPYWKLAGFDRNREMANEADMLIAFWDGKSKGTRHMIETAKKKNLEIELYIFNNDL